MSIFLRLLVVIIILSGCAAQSDGVELSSKKVVIVGDSITQNGKYVSYVEYLLQKKYPKLSFDIISVGLSSETVANLSEKDHPFPRPCVLSRIDNVLREVKPEVVIACYGMNDGIYHPLSDERKMAFLNGYNQLLTTLKTFGVKQIVIMGPPFFDNLPVAKNTTEKEPFGYRSPFVNYNEVLADYDKSLQKFASSQVCIVPLNSVMAQYVMKKRETINNFSLAKDGIHPNDEGHLLMAVTLLNGMGYSYSLSELRLNEIENDELFKLINQRRVLRSKGWLDYIGYVRGKTVKSESVAEIEAQCLVLQKQIEAIK